MPECQRLPSDNISFVSGGLRAATETARHGISGTKMQGWKLRHKIQWTAQTTFAATM